MSVDPEYLSAVDWEIDEVLKVVDGDTVRVLRSRQENLDESTMHIVMDRDDNTPPGASVRLITVNTPERGKPGWDEARQDVINWISAHRAYLRVFTWRGGGFDRLLGDIYYTDSNGNRHSLSQWLLSEGNGGRGWPYYEGKPKVFSIELPQRGESDGPSDQTSRT